METILLEFERKLSGRQAVTLGSRPEERNRENKGPCLLREASIECSHAMDKQLHSWKRLLEEEWEENNPEFQRESAWALGDI